jgi:transporter family protein
MTEKSENWLLPALGAMLVWGLWAFLPKVALQTMAPHSVIFYESLGNLCISLPVLVHLKFKLQHDRKALALIAAAGWLTVIAILSFFFALRHGPVPVIVTMTAMYPMIVVVLARVVLKERLNRIQKAAVGLAFIAILLLALPG